MASYKQTWIIFPLPLFDISEALLLVVKSCVSGGVGDYRVCMRLRIIPWPRLALVQQTNDEKKVKVRVMAVGVGVVFGSLTR